MSRFKIPNAYKPGIEAILNLSNEGVSQLLEVLETIKPGTGSKTFEAILSERLELSNVSLIAKTVFSFGSLLYSEEGSLEDIANDFVQSYSYSLDTPLLEDQIRVLEKRLIEIFSNCGNLRTTFKAFNLLAENENVFRDTHILTDVRLLFGDDLSDSNRPAVIIHRLKLEHQNDSEVSNTFYSLDSNDLLKLKQQIERAIEKEAMIKATYKMTVPIIEISE